MKIDLTKQAGIRLLTTGKICREDINVVPALQSKTADANGTYTPDEGYTGLAEVTVDVPIPDGYIQPSGTLTITENGTHDVTGFASVEVAVPGEVVEEWDGSIEVV